MLAGQEQVEVDTKLIGLTISALLFLALGSPVLSQAPPSTVRGDVSERVFVLYTRSAGEAVALIYPLLSGRGTVLVAGGSNALTVRDRPQNLARVEELIAQIDRPPNKVDLEFQIVSAGLGKSDRQESEGLSADLMVRLSELLRYRSFSLLAERKIDALDRQDVQIAVGSNYRVGFRLIGDSPKQRIRLEGFQLNRIGTTSTAPPLIHTHLDLRPGKPMILGLAKTESSPRALVVVINYEESTSTSS